MGRMVAVLALGMMLGVMLTFYIPAFAQKTDEEVYLPKSCTYKRTTQDLLDDLLKDWQD
jgi:hypothetical protein